MLIDKRPVQFILLGTGPLTFRYHYYLNDRKGVLGLLVKLTSKNVFAVARDYFLIGAKSLLSLLLQPKALEAIWFSVC